MALVDGSVEVAELTADLGIHGVTTVGWDELPALVAARESASSRWVWADVRDVYPHLLSAGVRVERCCDLRLCHAILAGSTYVEWATAADDESWRQPDPPASEDVPSLLDLPGGATDRSLAEIVAEHRRQQQAAAAAAHPERIRLLLAAESAGALIAAEMKFGGLPWSEQVHDRQLTELLGPRPLPGGRPAKLERLVGDIREQLGNPTVNPDSQPDLLRALRGVGIGVQSTRQGELERVQHPVIAPLLEYKKLNRLLTANGWAWMAAWVRAGRFRPDYVPAGVVTGRWATRGGGALQLPKQIRAAVVADPGYKLVVADAAQLEPRILAAMSRDEQMARASRRGDLYQALVDEQIVDTRAHAKVAMLGALYGATSGGGGQLMPRLIRAYPKATGLVEDAARRGERGGVVTTWLGRSSPPPPDVWHAAQRRASQPEATAAEQQAARRQARDWGRFTRNFVVQGTAAEWALCWMANLRKLLAALPSATTDESAAGGDQSAAEPRAGRAELVYFLHDEVIVHTPAGLAGGVEQAIRQAAAEAGRLMFGSFEVNFAVEIAVVDDYGQAK